MPPIKESVCGFARDYRSVLPGSQAQVSRHYEHFSDRLLGDIVSF